MRIHLISLLRNEHDILRSFIGHAAALFDTADLIDHLSTDGSEALIRNFCAQKPGWSFGQLKSRDYLQAQVSNVLMRRAFSRGADAVMFLDADEFINKLSRQDLERSIDMLSESRSVGAFFWRNCVPGRTDGEFDLGEPAWIGPISTYPKLIIPKWVYLAYGAGANVSKGNHSLATDTSDDVSVIRVGEILHFPLRSERQFTRKILTALIAQSRTGVAPHVENMAKLVANGAVDQSIVTGLAMNYGSVDGVFSSMTPSDLSRCGAELRIPAVAFSGDCAKLVSTVERDGLLENRLSNDGSEPIMTVDNESYVLDPSPAVPGSLEAAEIRIANLLQSTSWKITYPLRLLSQTASGVRRRARRVWSS